MASSVPPTPAGLDAALDEFLSHTADPGRKRVIEAQLATLRDAPEALQARTHAIHTLSMDP